MFRIKRGPVGGMRPMTQFESSPQAMAPQQDAAMSMLLQKIASLERALFGGQPGAPTGAAAQGQPQSPQPPRAYDGGPLPERPAGASQNYAHPFEGESGFDREGRVRLSHRDPDAPRLLAQGQGRYVMSPKPVPTAPPPQVGTTPENTYRKYEQAPPPRGYVSPIVEGPPTPKFTPPADMTPDDWKSRGWTLAR